jgi:molybdate transport system ATP-binding protein
MTSTWIIRLDDVDVELGGVTVLRGLSWRLGRGERWGVVGANGSGKTTFLGLIAGTLWPAPDRGERRYNFGRGELHDAVDARREIVVVSHELQDRYARWAWNFSGLDVVLSGVYRTDVPRRRPEAREHHRALATMRDLGVAHLAQRRFLELSRGEQRRVLIARGVAFSPSVLVLDEPASGLDRAARAELGELLARVSADVAIVCAAHVEADVPALFDRMLRLENGRIVAAGERGSADAAGARPQAHTDTALHRAARQSDGREATRRSRGASPASRREREAARLPIVELSDANVWLGARHVLRGITWRIEAHEHWLITGANGSGKSTLLRLLHGQLRPAVGGEIRWPALGNPRSVWSLRRQVAWLSPELQAAYRYPTTVRECIASGFDSSFGLTRELTAHERARVDELLTGLALVALAERPLSSLSYGQARRALIARALANRPRLLLLDEPWEGLDAPVSAALEEGLAAEIAAQRTQLVCASHLAGHRRLFTHELMLDAGSIVSSEAISV